MPFLTLTAVFLFIGPVLIIGIATMWSNLKQKISDELSARVTRIVNDLDTKNYTKITNELSARLSEVNSSFTAELGKNNNKLSLKSIHVMLATPQKRSKYWEDLITSKKPAELDP